MGGGGGRKSHLKMLCPGCSCSKTGSHMNTFMSLLIQEGFSGFCLLPTDGRIQVYRIAVLIVIIFFALCWPVEILAKIEYY